MGVAAPTATRLCAGPDAHEPVCDCFRGDCGEGGQREVFNTSEGFVPFYRVNFAECFGGKQKLGYVEG